MKWQKEVGWCLKCHLKISDAVVFPAGERRALILVTAAGRPREIRKRM
jgi:hypothetical protein